MIYIFFEFKTLAVKKKKRDKCRLNLNFSYETRRKAAGAPNDWPLPSD
jgi:hypothetical protein